MREFYLILWLFGLAWALEVSICGYGDPRGYGPSASAIGLSADRNLGLAQVQKGIILASLRDKSGRFCPA